MTPEERAWLAGLMEGEASFSMSQRAGNRPGRTRPAKPQVAIQMQMTDEDVVRKAHTIAGVGTVAGPFFRNGKGGDRHRPTWRWSVWSMDDLPTLLEEILPYMGKRRSARIRELLDFLSKYPKRKHYIQEESLSPA